MKYKVVYTIEADAKNKNEFFGALEELAHIIQEEFEYNCGCYNEESGGSDEISVSVNVSKSK